MIIDFLIIVLQPVWPNFRIKNSPKSSHSSFTEKVMFFTAAQKAQYVGYFWEKIYQNELSKITQSLNLQQSLIVLWILEESKGIPCGAVASFQKQKWGYKHHRCDDSRDAPWCDETTRSPKSLSCRTGNSEASRHSSRHALPKNNKNGHYLRKRTARKFWDFVDAGGSTFQHSSEHN